MLGAKTAAFVAVASLAVAETQAETAAHLHVRVHAKTTCPSGQQSIGVAGWEQDGCVTSGSVCVDQVSDGACPTGAHCALLDTGVYGCKDGAEEAGSWAGCTGTEQTIGVVGWDHDGCIDSANVCVAQVTNGDCPAGAYCSLLDTGVYGCVASSQKRNRHHKTLPKSSVTCPSGEETIGVAGWSQDGCVTSGNVCTGEVSDGDCPVGAHCELLDTGVYACADGPSEDGSANVTTTTSTDGSADVITTDSVNATMKHHHHHHKSHHKSSVTCPSGQETIAVAGWSEDGCVASGNVCVANTDGTCPSGAHCEWLDTGVFGCKDGAEEAGSWAGCTGTEQTIGVVGWDHDGCIDSANVCVAQVTNGDCPAGAYCSLLDTGVYGCVASSQKRNRHHKTLARSAVTCPSGQESIAVAGWSQDGCVASGNVCVANTDGTCPSGAHCEWLDTGVFGCKDGAEEAGSWAGCTGTEQTIGVVGWDHDGCIDSANVCVAQVTDGDCPAGAYCSLLDTGVYGCVASSQKRNRHHKTLPKSSVTCPSGEETIGVAGWSQDGCVTSGNVCTGEVSDGDCPVGAHCELLDTGVYACADGPSEDGSEKATTTTSTDGSADVITTDSVNATMKHHHHHHHHHK